MVNIVLTEAGYNSGEIAFSKAVLALYPRVLEIKCRFDMLEATPLGMQHLVSG